MITRLLRLGGAIALVSSLGVLVPSTALAAPVITITMPVGGQRTNDTTPPFAGTGGTGAGDAATITLDVYAGSDTTASPVRTFDVALSGGNWSLAEAAWDVANPALGEGDYTLVASQASDTGPGQASSAFAIDVTAPTTAVTGPASPIADRTPTLTGTAGTGTGDGFVHVGVYSGATLVRSVTTGGSPWSAALGLLADGDYTATAMQADSAGNAATSAPFAFTVAAGPARIVVVRNPGNNHDVYSQYLDGTGSVNLTNNIALEESPSFSADGTKMAFTSTRDGQREIYVRNMVTGVNARVTNTATQEIDPAISPDGTKIAFWRPTCCETQVFVIDADGSNEYAIPRPADVLNDQQPSWSPDGSKLVLSSLVNSPFSYDLTTVDANGANRQSVFLASGTGPIDESSRRGRQTAHASPTGRCRAALREASANCT